MPSTDKVWIANEKVTIFRVLRELGFEVSDAFSKTKVWCPFGSMNHDDGGRKRSFQVYPDTNTATCLSGCGFYRPVSLWATVHDLEPQAAAQDLLDRIGWVEPTAENRWRAALDSSQPYVDSSNLALALKTYCARVSAAWEFEQFEERVSDQLQRCFDLLPVVVTEADAEKWLRVTKEVMAQTLGVAHVETD